MSLDEIGNKKLLSFYKQHVEESILPFWTRALDHKNGGVYTCFNNTGNYLVSTDKYIWSQGRFLWLWSRVARMISEGSLDGHTEDYLDHLQKTALFLDNYAFLDNGNCAFLLTETGEKKESIPGKGFDTSFFADCFVVIGMAEYAGLIKDLGRFNVALGLYHRIVERLETKNFRSEPYPIPKGYSAHSVPMIMLNVAQGLSDVADELNHPEREELFKDSVSYMKDIMEDYYQEDYRMLEMLPDDPSETKTLLYRHVNPGHAIESMWFVMHAARKAGYPHYINKAVSAIAKADELGWDSEFGGLLRFVDVDGGKPKGEEGGSVQEKLITDTWDMKLWWPHSEALYSTLLAYELTGNEKMKVLYDRFHEYVFSTFPNPDKEVGEWIQIRDRKGKAIDKVAALPVKDPFHILRNVLLILNLLKQSNKGQQ